MEINPTQIPLTLGTVGSAAGKTTLTLALARHYGGYPPEQEEAAVRFGGPYYIETPEKSLYPMSRDPIYVHYVIAGQRLTHIDVTGARGWNHLALWGISEMDAAILEAANP